MGKTRRNQTLSCRMGRLYAPRMADEAPVLFVPVGDNASRPFGIDARDRSCRLATNAGFECAAAAEAGRPVLLANMRYAWDPAWLKAMRARPHTVLTFGGEPVLAHVAAGTDPAPVAAGMEQGQAPEGFEALAAETAELSYAELRKRE